MVVFVDVHVHSGMRSNVINLLSPPVIRSLLKAGPLESPLGILQDQPSAQHAAETVTTPANMLAQAAHPWRILRTDVDEIAHTQTNTKLTYTPLAHAGESAPCFPTALA